jgi:hypothetical protein
MGLRRERLCAAVDRRGYDVLRRRAAKAGSMAVTNNSNVIGSGMLRLPAVSPKCAPCIKALLCAIGLVKHWSERFTVLGFNSNRAFHHGL